MQKQVVVLSIVTLTLLSLFAGLGYVFIENKLNSPRKIVASSDTSSSTQSTQANATPQASSPTFQVQGAQTIPEQSNKLPEPAQFSVYEKYAAAQNTQFIDIVVGDGEVAALEDTIAVIYNGYLTSGQLFDQSKINQANQLEPIVFKIGAGTVIRGWEEGIVGMKVGGQRRLIIPSQLAYGPEGAGGGAIPPNSMLIFDVQLAQVQKAQQQGL